MERLADTILLKMVEAWVGEGNRNGLCCSIFMLGVLFGEWLLV